MSVLSESFVLAKTRSQDLKAVRRLNCWGNEFSDISLVRKMPNLEILCMSLNEITTLEDIGQCVKLRELIIRKNKIKSLSEIVHLQNLPHLENLWLEENPCSICPNYRKIVLRALPNLTVLDNIPVTQDELRIIEELGNEIYEEVVVEQPCKNTECINNEDSQLEAQATQVSDHGNNSVSVDHTINMSSLNLNESINDSVTYNGLVQQQQQMNSSIGSYQQSLANSVGQQPTTHRQCLDQRTQQQTSAYINNNNNNSMSNGNKQNLPVQTGRCSGHVVSAILCLIRDLDYVSCEIIKTELCCRMKMLNESSDN